jgi:TolA-binding protein
MSSKATERRRATPLRVAVASGIASAWVFAVGTSAVGAQPTTTSKSGQTTVELIPIDTSTAAAEVEAMRPDEVFTLAPTEYQPPSPPTTREIEGASSPEAQQALFERELNNYLDQAESFQRDIQDQIKTRFAAEKDRITGQYDRTVRDMEGDERNRRFEAVARFEEFLKKYPNDAFYSPDAMFRLAELYFERSSDEYLAKTRSYEQDMQAFERGGRADEPSQPKPDYAPTITTYNDLLGRFPDYRNADAARYLLGYSLEEMDRRDDALVQYQFLTERYPNSKFMPEVWTRIGEIYFDQNKPDSLERAAGAYAKVMGFTDSAYYDKGLYKLAWTYYRMDRLSESVERFIALVDYADQQKAVTGKSGSELRNEAIQYVAISLSDDRWGGLARAKEILGPIANRSYTAELWKRYGDVLFDQTKFQEAIDVYRLSIANYPSAPQNPEVQSKIVLAYERMRDFDGATKAREQLVSNYDEGSQWYNANLSDKAALTSARDLTERSLYNAAIYNHRQAQEFRRQNRAGDAKGSYARAAENYRTYLTRFPDSKNAYDFNFFLAECLFYGDDYLTAAKQYEKVRDSNADNRYVKDAALSAVIAYEKVIELDEGSGKLKKYAFKKANERKDEKIAPQDLEALRKDWVSASDRYTTLLPESDRAPPIMYRAAELYYRTDNFDEARKRFEKVIIGYPSTDVARYSANLIIETYLAAEDWDNVEKWSTRLMEIAQNSKNVSTDETKARGELIDNLKNFKVGARFKKAEEMDAKGDFEGAANMYVTLVNETPEHQFADKALFNAAVAYEKLNRFDAASKIYQRIADNYPKSDLADRSLFRVGLNYEKSFDFPAAISAYTQLVEKYPKSENRADSLYNVAVTLENMQQYGQAAVAFKRYATTFPDRDDAGDVFFRSGVVYEKLESWNEVIDTFSTFLTKYGRNPKQRERVVEAHRRVGQAQMKRKDERKALEAFKRCVDDFKRLGLTEADRAASQAATCSFEIAENGFRSYDGLKIEGTGKKQVAALTKKAEQQRAVEVQYREIFKYKRAETTLAALYRIGHSFERFAESMYAAQVPPELASDEELANEYRSQLEEKAAVLERKAESAYRTAYEEAKKTRVINEWTQRILEGLNKYAPDEFPVQKEGKSVLQTTTLTGNGLDVGGQ